jgi:hypothetical protein
MSTAFNRSALLIPWACRPIIPEAPSKATSFQEVLASTALRRGRFLFRMAALGLMGAGVFALLQSSTGHFLSHDLRYLGMDTIGVGARKQKAHIMRRQRASAPAGSSPVPARNTPKWMRVVLYTAGAYNLVWGLWVVLFPAALFHWAGMPPANYPQIWRCVGMIVGVYGIGYVIAARDPLRHWPMVFVGLLGKVLGPVGMWWSVMHGTLSSSNLPDQ